MKHWKCVFESQKGHPLYKQPDFEKFKEVVVSCKFKGKARELAEEELKWFDEQYVTKYRAPVIEQATDLELQQYEMRKLRLTGQGSAELQAAVLEPATGNESEINVYEFPVCAPWAIRIGIVFDGEKYGYSCLITDRSDSTANTDIGNIEHMISISFPTDDEALIAGLRQAANLMEHSEQLGRNQCSCIRIANGYCTLSTQERLERYVFTLEQNVGMFAQSTVISKQDIDTPEQNTDAFNNNMEKEVSTQERDGEVQFSDGHPIPDPAAVVDLPVGDHTSDIDDKSQAIEHGVDEQQHLLDLLNQELNSLEVGQVIIKDDLPNKFYHGCIGISSTNLKEELISSQYRHNLETGEIERNRKHCFIFGNFIHSLLLQPHLVTKEYTFEPELPEDAFTSLDSMKTAIREWNENYPDETLPLGGTKADLADRIRTHIDKDAVFKHELDEQWQVEIDKGLLPVTLDDQKRAQRMIQSALDNPAIRNWYKVKNAHTACERSYFTKTVINVFGQPIEMILKARLDKEIGSSIIDTKTIEMRLDVKEEDAMGYINREIEKRGYHLSAAHYLAITGKQKFYWIFHNKTPGYEWEIVIEAGDDHLQLGHFERNKALKSIARSIAKKQYNPPIVQPLDANNQPQPLLSEITHYGFKRLERYVEEHVKDNQKERDHDN